jgi:hypothetical protein
LFLFSCQPPTKERRKDEEFFSLPAQKILGALKMTFPSIIDFLKLLMAMGFQVLA